MPKVIEWRSRAEREDALFVVDQESGTVLAGYVVDEALLSDFLNEMTAIGTEEAATFDVSKVDPEDWGDLVLVRAEDGEVLRIDPERYWAGIAVWFRSRGDDPHHWRGRP
jgi:hypothetical protein